MHEHTIDYAGLQLAIIIWLGGIMLHWAIASWCAKNSKRVNLNNKYIKGYFTAVTGNEERVLISIFWPVAILVLIVYTLFSTVYHILFNGIISPVMERIFKGRIDEKLMDDL